MQSLRIDYIRDFVAITFSGFAVDLDAEETNVMPRNFLLDYSEELAAKCEALCKSIKGNSNAVFQLRKSSSSVFANITEAQYPQSLPDMLSKFKIARKEYVETESWMKMLLNAGVIDEQTFKTLRNLCGRIRRMLTASCATIEKRINNK